MRKIFIVGLIIICSLLLVSLLVQQSAEAVEYGTDVLESGNGGGSGGAKTFDAEFTVTQGEEFSADLWLRNVPCDLMSSGFSIEYDQTKLEHVEVTGYAPPWDPACWLLFGPGYPYGILCNLSAVSPDGDSDIIIVQVKFRPIASGDTQLRIETFPGMSTCQCFTSGIYLDDSIPVSTLTIHTIPPDSDADGVPDSEDKYPNSNMEPEITIQGCTTGVDNVVFPDGSTMSDLIGACAAGAKNHGAFVSCVTQLTNNWKAQGFISNKDKSAIQNCASKAK